MAKVHDAPPTSEKQQRWKSEDTRSPTKDSLSSSNAILPLSPAPAEAKRPSLCVIEELKLGRNEHLSFFEAFGVLGLPMLFIVLVCIVWTMWLILLTLVPTWTANHLMDTKEFDNGNFWLIVETKPWMTALSGCGLVLVALVYLYVLLKMVLWRNHQISNWSKRITKRLKWWGTLRELAKLPQSKRRQKLTALWGDLTNFHGKKRKLWNLWLKVIDLTLQTIALLQMLETGFPKTMAYCYAVLLAANALSCVVMILRGPKHSAFTEVLVDSIFDLLFAVVTPIAVLTYCYSNFDFDRQVLQINNTVMPAGSFERQSRLMTNPSEIFLFRTSFDSLRILSITDFLLRIGMNLSFCNRFKCVAEVQIGRKRRMMFNRNQRSFSLLLEGEKLVPRLAAVPFVLFAILVLFSTHKSIETSAAACAQYPQCVVYARRWNSGHICPCLTLIDTDKEPKTFDEWMNPVDDTEVVQELAESGDLRVLQLINRRLEVLPDELRHCVYLKHMTLMYTQTRSLPPWMKTFKELEYLHIEGKSGFANLLSLPEDLFEDMHELELLHLGVHTELAKLPSFEGLSSLKEVMLAYMFSVTSIPPFTEFKKLERMELVYFPALPTLPDMASMTNLHKFSFFRPMQICCNGFLGSCDLTHPYCTQNPAASIPQVTCLQSTEDHATPKTLEIVNKYAASVCQSVSDVIPEVPSRSLIDMCEGTPFRQCQLPAVETNGSTTMRMGICWNTRMQVLACTLDPYKILVRKQQILHRAGETCNPAVEAWLGCSA